MKYIYSIILSMLTALCAMSSYAFSPDVYASQSRMAQGKWVKISVPASGIYMITNSQLRQWGFSDASKVRVYGYGGKRISDVLSLDAYTDDVPLMQSLTTDKGIIFYGVGPEDWTFSTNGVYVNNSNIYTTVGYYFLSDSGEEPRQIREQTLMPAMPNFATTYQRRDHYELDRVSPGESGFLLVGESFKSQPNRKFTFSIPGSASAMLECGIVSNSSTAATVEFTANGQKLGANSSDRLSATSSSHYVHGTHNACVHQFSFTGDKLELSINIPAATSMSDCWLDYIAINTQQPLALPSAGHLLFHQSSASISLAAAKDAVVWDVTNPLNISAPKISLEGDNAQWTNEYSGERTYVAFKPTASLPAPTLVGTIPNQNLHATECVDMVIFSLPDLLPQAERIAEMHRADNRPLKVAVMNVNEVYNEFASGSPDVSALRRCMKMLYDRGMSSDSLPTLGYAMLMGRSTYDNRFLTGQFDKQTSPRSIPCWLGGERRTQLSDNTAFGTDDFIAILADNSGINLGLDDLSVAVGRMPVRTPEEARSAVDKLVQYVEKNKMGTWRNSFLFLADDGDNGTHVNQTENIINEMLATPDAHNLISKVYVDAYDILASSCEGGRQDMYRMLDEGVVWWNFCGHANNHSWTAENMLNFNDINNLFLSRIPVLMAATCDFLRWDSATLSGGEIMYHERYGGTIATISATRPVYISDNGYFTRAIGRAINKRDSQGLLPRLGDIYRIAKNNILTDNGEHRSNSNRLRYVLMGDPAMQLAMPHNIVRIESIGDTPVTPDSQATLMALQRTTINGVVTTPDGKVIEDFDGTVEAVIYDAERSITTKGVRDENVKITFEQHGDKLYAGSAPVAGGRFSIEVAMPMEIANNFRPATINLFAYTKEQKTMASGINRDCYVYDFDESAPIDSIAPSIDSMILNHASFKNGDTVNESPMLIADVADDVAINLSSAGVGHQMTLTLDDTRTYTDVSLYYTPSTDGKPSGSINYPLENLTEGHHTLRLRVWDTSGNSANREIDFVVAHNLPPTIYNVYTDANPASTEANFYLSHDRPDAHVSVTITIYDLLGRPLWNSTVNGRSDMFLTSPVTWNLCDSSGRRVPRGIYVYRATISTDSGETYDTASRKLAVTAR